MKKDFTSFLFLLLLAFSCDRSNDPQRIIDQVIENHGGKRYENFRASFDFRDIHYVMQHKNGYFQYERHFSNDDGQIKDILNNDGFKRYLNDHDITDTVKKAAAYARSVNSVAYFALLPYRLNDPAVIKKYLGTEEIRGEPYHKIEVTFEKEKGGEDYTDIFVYWMHSQNLTMDYFAYLYYTDGGGKRFRAPVNIRTVGGIRFSDYENYKEVDDNVPIYEYGQQYNQAQLEILSRILMENIEVQLL